MYAVGIYAASVNSVTIIYCARAFQTSFGAKNPDYLQFAEGWIAEKIGDTFAAQNDPGRARANYQKTLEIWQNEKAAPTNHGYSAAKINYLREKTLR